LGRWPLRWLKWSDSSEDRCLRGQSAGPVNTAHLLDRGQRPVAHTHRRRGRGRLVWINELSKHFLGAAFGGYKQSGIGRRGMYRGASAFHEREEICELEAPAPGIRGVSAKSESLFGASLRRAVDAPPTSAVAGEVDAQRRAGRVRGIDLSMDRNPDNPNLSQGDEESSRCLQHRHASSPRHCAICLLGKAYGSPPSRGRTTERLAGGGQRRGVARAQQPHTRALA